MLWQNRRDIFVALVALPAVHCFCPIGGIRPSSTFTTDDIKRDMIPAATLHRWASVPGQPQAVDGRFGSQGVPLKMQQAPGYGGSGEGYQVPGGGGSGANPGDVTPPWTPRSPVSDGFGEGVPRLNTVFLTGYLGQDPKPRYFDSGKVVLNLSLAVKREYHPIERKALGVVYGEEETDWFQLEMWNRDAEYAAKVCKKGGRVGVTGALNINEWTDRDGNPRTTVKILVNNLEILDSRAERASRSDNSEDNLWESERLQKADAAAQRQTGGGGAGRGGGVYQSPEELATKARKKAAEDKWWSAEPDTAAGTSTAGGDLPGTDTVPNSGQAKETNWWDEDGGGGGTGASKGVEADSLPSFFDE